jgi:hypothetical protein
MKSYKRIALISAIVLVGLGCVGAGALLVLERPVTHQLLATTLSSAHGTAGPSVTAPAPVRQDSHLSAADRKRIEESYARMPLSFEANAGQTDSRVKFLSRGHGYTLFLTGNDAVLSLRSPSSDVRGPLSSRGGKRHLSQRTPNPEPRTLDTLVRMRVLGADASAAVSGVGELPGKANYFIGNDPKKWRTDVPTYSQVRYRDVYPGIDLVYHGNQGGQLQYDFVVAPGAEPQAIALAVGAVGEPRRTRGDAPVRIARDGDLVIPAKSGDLRFRKPVAYQEATKIENRRLVEAHFTLDAQNRVHFALGPFDHTQPLVIDPTLLWATYLGGSAGESGYGIAVDSSGNAYVTGYTASSNFPTDPSKGSSLTGSQNAFVAKLNWSGSALSLVYSTYLGGSDADSGNAIAIDSAGNAYVTGSTSSPDFPQVNSLQGFAGTYGCKVTTSPCPSGQSVNTPNAFVTQLNSTGSSFVFSTYLGGEGTGTCTGPPYPGTCTFYGDSGQGIAVLTTAPSTYAGVYVTGYTYSSNFPNNGTSCLTPGCTLINNEVQSSLKGTENAFTAELYRYNSNLYLIYSTFLGGSFMDAGYAIAVDQSDNAYVTGVTSSSDFPTASPLVGQSVLENGTSATYTGGALLGSQNAFVAAVNWNSAANTLSWVYSTYLGGTGGDAAYGIALDSFGNADVTGVTQSTDFPILNPVQTKIGGSGDVFVASLKWASGVLSLVYSTYLGGSGWDLGYGIATDSSGDAYVSGYTSSSNFPTVSPFQSFVGGPNAFVAELNWAPATSTLSTVYSTYLGGGGDYGYGIAVDSSKNAYVTGTTSSSGWGLHSLEAYAGGATDAFVAEISPATAPSAGVTLGSTACTSGKTCATLAFGSVTKSTSSTQSVTLTSSGTGSLTISSIAISGTGFAFASPVPSTACSKDVPSTPLSPSSTCTIDVTFTPPGTTTYNGTVTITDNASSSTQTITLSGTGTTTAAGVTLGSTACTSGVACATLAFGSVQQSNSSTKSVTLKSSGTGSLTISSIGISGTGFAFASPVPSTACSKDVPSTPLSPSSTCTIDVTFTPPGTTAYGGTVTITDNASTSPQTITLSGTGITPGIGKTKTTITGHSPNPSSVGQGVTVKFTVAPVAPATGTPTGTVTVSDGTGDSCTAAAPSGSCVLTITTAGTKTLTAAYPGDSNFSASTSAGVSQTVAGFGISASPSSQSVTAGLNANFEVTVTSQNGFSGNVSLSCSGAPAGSSCTFNHPSLHVTSASGPGQAVALVTTTLSTTKTTYTLTFTGTSGGGTQSTTAKLTVD